MSALYLHVPFCRQACHYCDFHFSTNLQPKKAMVAAMVRELALQQHYLTDKTLSSVYFGGGTPSLLDTEDFAAIFGAISAHFRMLPDAEITVEANPDDLTPQKLADLKALGCNRLSIGIQSFNEAHLRYLNRAHTAQHAADSVRLAQAAGFDNLTIDLIYAIPHQDHSIWEQDLAQAIALGVPHISAYCLTIEEKTVFGNWLKKQQIQAIDDDYAAEQFERLVATLGAAGYEQYEISNFARKGAYSRHNSNYWKKGTYLGIGPGAHSYNGQTRQYNVANNALYVRQINNGTIPCQTEQLSLADHVNEYILTCLRTQWGCDTEWLQAQYGVQIANHAAAELDAYLVSGHLVQEGKYLKLTEKGKLLADQIASDLFMA